MFSHCTNYTATMPDIAVYMNCDTQLAINLRALNLGDNDELIFTIKNFNYIDSPYVFMFRTNNAKMDQNGEVFFKITPAVSKHLKPGAFYNFTVLLNAFDSRQETEYRKLTDNGSIILEYGAQDLLLDSEFTEEPDYEIISLRLEPIEAGSDTPDTNGFNCEIAGVRLEQLDGN